MKNGGILISMCSGIGCLRWLIYNKMWKGLFVLLIICYNLRTANFILQAQTFLDFYVHTIAQSGGYLQVTTGLSNGVNIEIKKGLSLKDKVRGPQIVADNKEDE